MARKFRLGRSRKNAERKSQQHKKSTCFVKKGRPTKKIGIQQLSTGIYLPPLWSNQSSMQFVHFCKIEHGSSNQTAATVTKSVTINEDLSWSVNVHGHKLIAGKCNALCCVKDKITTKAALSRLVHQIDSLSVCSGNPDSHFLELADARKGICHSPSKNMVAFIDSFFPVMFEDEMYSRTLRCNECELLVTNNRCDTCKQYRCTLRALHSQWLRQQKKTANHASISSHTNFRYLKTPERQQRIRRLRNEIVNKRKEVERLKSYVNVATEQHGIYIEEALEKDIKQIMEEKSNEIRKTYQADSFQCIFWNQQLELLKLKDKRQIRWHPMIIRWCLSLKLLSSASYHALRSSNLVILPSERTLRDYTNIVKAKTGFSTGIDAQLCHEANIDSIPDHEKYVCLVFDEVKIKEDLVFDKHSLELVGFVQIGDINTHLSKFESCSMPQKTPVAPQLATHMLSFMVSGIMTDLQFPYVSFPCSTISGDQLYSMVWGCIRRLETCGFKVLAVTCDGASSNRTFMKLHQSGDNLTYKTINPYANEDRPLFFISDPSHLIKTVRNCWANSYGHSYTRKLKINGQDISWQHLVDLYKAHRGPDCATLGLSILPKLKWEHIELNSYSKMRVDLAAQVLSTTVAEAFAYENSPHTKETERFVRIFDKFFDLMNTRNTKEFVLKRKPNLAPYINNPETEERLKWLQDVFLPYLDEWEAYAHAQEHLSSAEQIKLCLSQETLQGLRITVHAFIELVRYLLKQPRVVYVLSAKLSQDCVESFFGKQRMRGGYCENPNVSSFISGAQSLRVQSSTAIQPRRGNCRLRVVDDVCIDDRPLPKRKRISKKK